MLANFATLLYYDPKYLTEKDGAEGPPNWIYFTCADLFDRERYVALTARCRWAAGLFLYQTLDAIDGYVLNVLVKNAKSHCVAGSKHGGRAWQGP